MRAAYLLILAVACAPTQAELFDPVSASTEERVGVRAEWRRGSQRSPQTGHRIADTLAKPLTADGAALVAVLNSPALQAAYAELGVAGGALSAARTLQNPEAEAEIVFPVDEGHTTIELSAVMSVTQLVDMVAGIRGADASLRAARRRAVAMTIEVAAEARVAYFDAAAAEHMLALRRIIADAAEASATLARSLYEAGNITALDLARETVFEEEARLELLRAEADAAVAREAVNRVLGLEGAETAWTIDSELPRPPDALPDLSGLEEHALRASLDLEALRFEAEAAGHRVRLYIPDLHAGVAVKREDHWGVGPVIGFSIPLFDWGGGARTAARAAVTGLQQRYTATAVTVRSSARAARARLASAHQRVVRIRTVLLPLREKLLDEAVRQYNAMNLDAFQLLLIRREHVEAEARYVAALRDFWTAHVRVDQLRRGGLPGDTGTSSGGPAALDAPSSSEAH